MTAYIVRRLLAVVPVMVTVAVFVFFLVRLAPGDPAAIIAGEDATEEAIEAVRAKLGLDRPMLEQFVIWVGRLLQGDLGMSIFSNLPVSHLIAQRLEPTVALTLSTLLVAICLAVPIGVVAAWKARKLADRVVMIFAVLGFALPGFLVAYVLIYLFAVKLNWLPVQGYRPLSEGFWPFVEGLILPSVTLGTTYMALIARITRASMLEVLSQDYIRTARAKGLRERTVVYKHGLRNGLIPIVTIIGLMLPTFVGGAVIVESLFSWPGIGKLFIDAVFERDYPVIMGITMLGAVMTVAGNLLADVLYAVLDPRIEY